MHTGSQKNVAVVMGSPSDWKVMEHACVVLDTLQITWSAQIISAHRTPERLYTFAKSAREEGFRLIIAGAGGAAHLPGMIAALTPLPVFGVPVPIAPMQGTDSLHSIVQMPSGVPVGTLAIGNSGAANAAHLAARILALGDPLLASRLDQSIRDLESSVPDHPTPSGNHSTDVS